MHRDGGLLAHHESEEEWVRARRAVLVQRVVCAFKSCSVDLIPFEEARKRLLLTQRQCLGVQEVDLDRIRGSVGRPGDFTSAFLPRKGNLRDRWVRVHASDRPEEVPAVELYKVGDAYFVVDGNHRVSSARRKRMKTITADVCEFETPVGLSAEADLREVIIRSEQAAFLNKTGLDRLRPGHELLFTTPGRYRELDCMIDAFREALTETRGETVGREEALLLWYDEVFLPAVAEIKRTGIPRRLFGSTAADLFLWMWRHRRRLAERYIRRSDEREAVAWIGRVLRLGRRRRSAP